MKKKQIKIIGIVIIAGLLLLLLLMPNNNKNDSNKTSKIVMQPSPTLTRENKTGGLVEQTPDEEKVAKLISDLRLASPVDAGTFTIIVNWKNGKFVVEGKNGKATQKELVQWLEKNDYSQIQITNFEFK